MKNRFASFSCCLVMGFMLTACQTPGGQTGPNDGAGANGDSSTTGVVVPGIEGEVDDANSLGIQAPNQRVIYFDFDKSEIRPEYLDIVTQHGRFLAANPSGRVRLEGHTDERGSREYNIALGERRAQSIAQMLQLQGVSSAQTRAVSYGEELPVDEAHNSEAWAKNRRVIIIYETSVQN